MNNQYISKMEKKKSTRGGKRANAGRKPKAEEVKLIEKLTPLDALAFRQLKKGVTSGNYKFLELFLKYRWGNPKSTVDVTSGGESFSKPIIDFFSTDEDINK